MQIGRVVILCLLALQAACAGGSTIHAGPAPAQPIAPGVTLTLPDNPPFGNEVGAVQLVQARYRSMHQIFQSTIESSSDHFIVAMTVPSGPGIMRMDWSHGVIAAKREPIAPESLSAARMLADLMFVYAPADVLRKSLDGGEFVTMGERSRTVFRNGRPVVQVTLPAGDVWNGHATLVNYAFDYTIDIQSRRVSP